MGWKTIDGRRYYYKSERDGGRVKSIYFGAGEAGTLMAQMVAFDRLDRVAEREKLREERQESDAEETAVSEWFDQVQAGAESDGAEVAGCASEAVAEWLRDDPEFIAGLNWPKSFRRDRLRADVLSLASDAMATLRELVSGRDVPPSVRLRASLAILDAANVLKAEELGPTSAAAVRAKMEHKQFIDSLG
jgi:hypothetical protein